MPVATAAPVLTAADIAHYDEHGWWASDRPVLDADEIAAARAAVERLHARGVPEDAPMAGQTHLNWRPGADAVMRINNYAAFLDPALRRLACHPAVGALAAQLSGSPLIRLFNSTLVYKPGSLDDPDTVVGWHTDKAYWGTCTSSRMLTAWIPLYDVGPDSAPLTVLDGSHRWPAGEAGDLQLAKGFVAADRPLMEAALRARNLDYRPVTLTMKAGHLSFHHCLTFHGSAPNTAPRPRVSLTVHLQDGANRWRPAVNQDGSAARYQHDDKVRADAGGNPDYTDPRFCPVVWPEQVEDTR